MRGCERGPGGWFGIRFFGTALPQVAGIYSGLVGQPVRISPGTPQPVLIRNSPTGFKRGDARHGIEVLLGLNGLAVVPDEPRPGLKIVPLAEGQK